MDGVFSDVGGHLTLTADWNAIYRDNEDPWNQSGKVGDIASYYALSRSRLTKAIQRHMQRPGDGLEIGCGHGHVIKHLSVYCSNVKWSGLDISDVAIETAKHLQPKKSFYVADIANGALKIVDDRFDVTVLNQVLWYVLENFDHAVDNCIELLWPDGVFIISQAFLKGEQRYGREIVDGFHGLLDLMRTRYAARLRLIEASYDDRGQHLHHDGLLAFRKL